MLKFSPVVIDGKSLRIDQVLKVARENEEVKLSQEACAKVKASRGLLDKWVSESKVVYGLNTGCGPLNGLAIPANKLEQLQENLIRSHASGVGNTFPNEAVRAMMLIRANVLARGFSGVRLNTLTTLVDMINAGICPIVPEHGSLGASGDLVPLSHIALGLMGEGTVEFQGEHLMARDAFDKAKIEPVKLSVKEGLALINGTSSMLALATLVTHDALNLVKTVDIVASMTFEALRSVVDCLDEKIHLLRMHSGQIHSAYNMRKLIEGSELVVTCDQVIREIEKAKEKESSSLDIKLLIQDAYSIRCTPQVHGAAREAVDFVKGIIERELNAVTDNPLVDYESGKPLHGGNFHGQPIALAMDVLSIAVAEMAVISERRLNRIMDPRLNKDLPMFLAKNATGLESGLNAVHYVAASLSSECVSLASPASLFTITTDADNQDIVSMGLTAAKRATEIARKVEYVIASEFLSAAEALDRRAPLKLGKGTKIAHQLLRTRVPPLTQDRSLSGDLEAVAQIIRNGEIVRTVEKNLKERLY